MLAWRSLESTTSLKTSKKELNCWTWDLEIPVKLSIETDGDGMEIVPSLFNYIYKAIDIPTKELKSTLITYRKNQMPIEKYQWADGRTPGENYTNYYLI